MDLTPRVAALKAVLDALPGATATPMSAGRSAVPLTLMYKIMGKTFAILQVRVTEVVLLKSDPHLAEILRETYEGVGRRTHLDPRFWIAVWLDKDVPQEEIERLAARSYDLVRDGLTKKQKAELAALEAA